MPKAKTTHRSTKPRPKRSAAPKPKNKRRAQRAPSFLGVAARLAGKYLPKIMGLGTYHSKDTFKRNSILGMGVMPPEVSTSRKSTIVTHKEYIVDVLSSTNSNTNLVPDTNLFAFPLQPASPLTFPWLSSIAESYQEYRFLGCVFEFKSTCGSAITGTNNAMGSVLMSTQYRSSDPPFTTKQQMDNEQYATDIVPWTNGCHFIECAPHLSPLTTMYVRTSSTPPTSIELCDLGTMYLATTGQQASGVVLGELWVTYQIELLKPQLAGPSAAPSNAVLSFHGNSSTYTNALPLFGCLPLPGSNINVSFIGAATKSILNIPINTFVSGDVLLFNFSYYSGTTVTVNGPAVSVFNLSPMNTYSNQTTAGVNVPTNGTSTSYFSYFVIARVTSSIQVIQLGLASGGTLPPAGNMDVVITQLNGAFTAPQNPSQNFGLTTVHSPMTGYSNDYYLV